MSQTESYRDRYNLTPEQQDYDIEWVRGEAFYKGKAKRPWVSLGFRSRVGFPDLSLSDRFVHPNRVDVVALRQPRRLENVSRRRVMEFPAPICTPYTDMHGQPMVGGIVENLIRTVDFAASPLQESPVMTLQVHDGELLVRKRFEGQGPAEEPFTIRRDAYWIDLCVGSQRGVPIVQYRIPIKEAERKVGDRPTLELTEERAVAPGSVLGRLHRKIEFYRANFSDKGVPEYTQCRGFRISATRAVPLFRLLNRMHKEQNDMVLLEPEDRPPVLNPELTPRAMVVLTEGQARNIIGMDGWEETQYLRDLLLQAVGCKHAEQGYHILAEASGKYGGEEPYNVSHLKVLKIGDSQQVVPSTAVLLKGIDVGTEVKEGQPIADICERFQFNRWENLDEELGPNLDHYLVGDFLAQRMIFPGQKGWTGPGVLLDYQIASPVCAAYAQLKRGEYDLAFQEALAASNGDVVKAEASVRHLLAHLYLPWVFDFEPSRSYWDDHSRSYCLPPAPHLDDSNPLIGIFGGIDYSVATRNEIERSNAQIEEEVMQDAEQQPATVQA